MLESISFWAMYGLLSYLAYVGVFTIIVGLIFMWINSITDNDYCTMDNWKAAYNKWLPVDTDNSSNGAIPAIAVCVSLLMCVVVNIAIPQGDKDLHTGHQVLVALSEGLIGVGYFIAIAIMFFVSTAYIKQFYIKAKAFKAKLDKVK